MSHYQTLGLPNNASEDQVKKAYRTLAKKYHPDVNSSADASATFIKINNSYEQIMSGNGNITLNTYTYYKKPEKPFNPANEFDLDGDGKLSREEWRAMKRQQLEESARAFYNLYQTSTGFRIGRFFYYLLIINLFLVFTFVMSAFVGMTVFALMNEFPILIPIIVTLIIVASSLVLASKMFMDMDITRMGRNYVKIIRKFYDPKFRVFGIFKF